MGQLSGRTLACKHEGLGLVPNTTKQANTKNIWALDCLTITALSKEGQSDVNPGEVEDE